MDPDFWHLRWRQSEIGFHQADVNRYLIEYLEAVNSDHSREIWVPLCGKSRDMIWLSRHGYRVSGIELSDLAVEQFFHENELEFTTAARPYGIHYHSDAIEIVHGDYFQLPQDIFPHITLAYDRAALIALPPELRAAYVQRGHALLPNIANILLISLEYNQSEMSGPPFSVAENEIRELYGEGYRVEVLCDTDVLERETKFREKGISSLREKVYHIRAT